MKVKIFEISTGLDKEELEEIELEMNEFLTNHKIKEIHQSGAGAGGSQFSADGTHIITIFYE